MDEPGGANRRGIEIPAEVAEAAGVPDDLDADAVGEYAVPDTSRRRTAGLVYVGAAVVAALAAFAGVGAGFWVLCGVFLVVAGYHVLSGKRLKIREGAALDVANRATPFAVGHASATLGFDGLMARPVWNVLVFSAEDPPAQRGLVRVDAQSGDVVEQYVETIEA